MHKLVTDAMQIICQYHRLLSEVERAAVLLHLSLMLCCIENLSRLALLTTGDQTSVTNTEAVRKAGCSNFRLVHAGPHC